MRCYDQLINRAEGEKGRERERERESERKSILKEAPTGKKGPKEKFCPLANRLMPFGHVVVLVIGLEGVLLALSPDCM